MRGLEVEAGAAGIKNVDAREIGWQQVAGEAHPLELEAESAGKGFGQGGFAYAGQVFDQQMAAGQQAGQGQPHRLLLAQQHLADGADQRLQPGAGHGAGAKNTIVTALPPKLH